MSAFYSHRDIKSTRKPHTCESCETRIAVGSPAKYWAGDVEGEFYTCHYHPDCREAESAWNDWAEFARDEWCQLYHFYDERGDANFCEPGAPSGFLPELMAKWPAVLERLQAREQARNPQ